MSTPSFTASSDRKSSSLPHPELRSSIPPSRSNLSSRSSTPHSPTQPSAPAPGSPAAPAAPSAAMVSSPSPPSTRFASAKVLTPLSRQTPSAPNASSSEPTIQSLALDPPSLAISPPATSPPLPKPTSPSKTSPTTSPAPLSIPQPRPAISTPRGQSSAAPSAHL